MRDLSPAARLFLPEAWVGARGGSGLRERRGARGAEGGPVGALGGAPRAELGALRACESGDLRPLKWAQNIHHHGLSCITSGAHLAGRWFSLAARACCQAEQLGG